MLRDLIIDFTTGAANEDIFDAVMKAELISKLGFDSSSFNKPVLLDLEIYFSTDYTGNVTFNPGWATKAYANRTISWNNKITSIVIEANGTSGQVRVRW